MSGDAIRLNSVSHSPETVGIQQLSRPQGQADQYEQSWNAQSRHLLNHNGNGILVRTKHPHEVENVQFRMPETFLNGH